MLFQQGLDRLRGIVMEPIALLAAGFALDETLSVGKIVSQGDSSEVIEQILLTLGDEQHLIRAQRT